MIPTKFTFDFHEDNAIYLVTFVLNGDLFDVMVRKLPNSLLPRPVLERYMGTHPPNTPTFETVEAYLRGALLMGLK